MESHVPYDLLEHRHRFAVWAAARASQRGFTTVENLRGALEDTDIRSAPLNSEVLQLHSSAFEDLHRRWCTSICSALTRRGIPAVPYGRAAKLVAVYLKTTVIMGEGADTPLGHSIHPPVDRTLLRKLAASPRIQSPHKTAWCNTNWTQLGESEYYTLIAQLREVVPSDLPFWMLEEYWNASEDEEGAL
jgi:hypothetical protein